MDDKNIMIPLDDTRAKYISEVIGNKSCKKILNYLAENEGSVSEIASGLKMPLNTIDYNIKKLIKSGLIKKSSHWWSVKGKKMPIYCVSDKRIVIYPKRRKIGAFLWTGILTLVGALTIRQFTEKTISPVLQSGRGGVSEMMFANKMVDVEGSVPILLDGANEGVGFFVNLSPWGWFLAGAWLAIFLFFVFTLYNEIKARGLS